MLKVLNMHLLLPLFSSVVFVFGMMFARKALGRGARAWTGTFYGNLWLGLIWLLVGVCRWDVHVAVRRVSATLGSDLRGSQIPAGALLLTGAVVASLLR